MYNFSISSELFDRLNIICFGNETSLNQCQIKQLEANVRCPNGLVAEIQCRTKIKICAPDEFRCSIEKCINAKFVCDGEKDCDDGKDEICEDEVKARLVDGPNEYSGRVEIKRHGQWGTVCHNSWDAKDALVICKMIGFQPNPNEVVAHPGKHFPPGNGLVWLGEADCNGDENSIDECDGLSWGKHICSHDEDAGVTCFAHGLGIRSSAVLNFDQLKLHLEANCGRLKTQHFSRHSYRSSARVVGGQLAMPGNHPWQVGVRIKTGSGKTQHWCGGSIINHFHFISAAHCFIYQKEIYIARAGDYNNNDLTEDEQEFSIDKIIFHPNYDTSNYNNDIVLVKISPGKSGVGFRYNWKVQPVCLPSHETYYTPGVHCMVSGWGKVQHNGNYAHELKEAEIPIIPWTKCRDQRVYGSVRITKHMFCAGYLSGGIDTCQGDSGGPFVCQYNDQFRLFGVVSWGDGCGDVNKPGVYVRVADYVDWILKSMYD
ncbi:hypothetical protein CHUAL_011248 [Chamberlinius hualienensis]